MIMCKIMSGHYIYVTMCVFHPLWPLQAVAAATMQRGAHQNPGCVRLCWFTTFVLRIQMFSKVVCQSISRHFSSSLSSCYGGFNCQKSKVKIRKNVQLKFNSTLSTFCALKSNKDTATIMFISFTNK